MQGTFNICFNDKLANEYSFISSFDHDWISRYQEYESQNVQQNIQKAKFIYSSYLYLGKDLFSKGFELHGKMSAVEYLNIGLKAISKAIVINIKEREKEKEMHDTP